MKTTLEISDDLFRAAKAKAALEGIKLKELVERGLAREVHGYPSAETKPVRAKFPLIRRAPGAPKLDLTPQRIHELEMEAEMERYQASLPKDARLPLLRPGTRASTGPEEQEIYADDEANSTAGMPSAHDLMKDCCGMFDSGVDDLSTNPKHMEGFGRDSMGDR